MSDLYAIDAATMQQIRMALGRLRSDEPISNGERRSYAIKLDTLLRQSVQLKYSDIKTLACDDHDDRELCGTSHD